MRIYDRTFHILGTDLRLRITPPAFKHDMKIIQEYVDLGNFEAARIYIKKAIEVWGPDEELVRVDILISFLLGE